MEFRALARDVMGVIRFGFGFGFHGCCTLLLYWGFRTGGFAPKVAAGRVRSVSKVRCLR
jgi:hypothetical protein